MSRTITIKANKPIRVRSHRFGIIHLRILTVRDLSFALALVGKNLSPRDFVARLIHHQIIKPSLDLSIVNEWSDRLLLRVAAVWVASQFPIADIPDQNVTSFAGIQSIVVTDVNATINRMSELATQFLQQYQPLFATIGTVLQHAAIQILDSTLKIQEAFTQVSQVITQQLNLGPAFRQIHETVRWLREWQLYYDQLENQGKQSVQRSGYGYIVELLPRLELIRLGEIQPSATKSTVTRRLVTLTKGADFEEQLRHIFQSSPILRHRWPIVGRALIAHQQGNYLLSVPALLPQVEGVMADILIFDQLAVARGSKVFLKNPKGLVKRNRRGNQIELRGMGSIVQNPDLQRHVVIKQVVDVLANVIIPERNPILHGRRTTYGTSRLSTQALLVLLICGKAVAAFEDRNR